MDDLEAADIVIAMKPGLDLPIEPSGRYLQWQFPDPTDWTVDNVRPLREAVQLRIRQELLARQP